MEKYKDCANFKILTFCVQLKMCILKASVKYISINSLISKEIVRVNKVREEICPSNDNYFLL